VTAYIEIKNDYHKGLGLAKKAFSEAKDYYKSEAYLKLSGKKFNIKGIKGVWLNSEDIIDNYNAFMKIYNPAINNFEEAAFSTATGKIANELGFTKVDLNLSPNPPIKSGEIIVYFVEP
jgi:hypothetical protein